MHPQALPLVRQLAVGDNVQWHDEEQYLIEELIQQKL